MHRPARGVAATLAAAAVLVLTGCTAGQQDAGTTPEATEVEQSPEPTEPEIVVPGNGEALTTVEQVAAAREAGYGVYTMNDGTKVAIDPSQPLPQPVVDEGVADAQANWQGDMMESIAKAGAFVRETGKNIAFIVPLYGSEDGVNAAMFWAVAGATNPASPLYARDSGYPGGTNDVESQISWAEQWIATRPASENWQIVVTPAP